MKILILAEPRSGSTNLTNWFYFNKSFTTLFLPSNPSSQWYRGDKNLNNYIHNTEHLLVKEDYKPDMDFSEFLKTSDKIIFLYRENEKEQIESWTNAVTTNNWYRQWTSNRLKKNENQEFYFKTLKESFREKYLNENNFTISYEELYYRNGIERIITYLGIEELKGRPFPVGKKYRVDTKPQNLI